MNWARNIRSILAGNTSSGVRNFTMMHCAAASSTFAVLNIMADKQNTVDSARAIFFSSRHPQLTLHTAPTYVAVLSDGQ